MRKTYLRTILIVTFATFVTLQSCKKDELKISESITLDDIEINVIEKDKGASDQNIFAFNTLEDYEKTLSILSKKEDAFFDSWPNNSDFISMKEAYKNNMKNIPIEDDILITSLINKHGEIQIEDKVFKLNFENEEVEVTENLSKNKSTYSFEDDVLVLAFNIEEEQDFDKGYCSSNSQTVSMSAPYGVTVTCKVAYVKLGIYHTLYAKVSKSGSGTAQVKIGLETIYYNVVKYENKKGCWTYEKSLSGYNNSYTLRPYQDRFRRLNAYRIPINFWYWHPDNEDNRGLNMSCGSPDC